ncbi:acyl-CoA dehydrogenase family protein [Corynebacterium bovis]|uniref:acyl-CoA dehydrogenase family protein n=1 Tax=Corynebacterium bovis TaxID=36808 RepID=UPI003138E9FA
MDLELNDEQTMLAETAKDVFGRAAGDPGHAPEDGLALRTDVWAAVARLGLTGLTVPEEYDGAGAGVAEVYAAMSAAGAAAATEPLIDGAYLASWLIGDLGDDGQRSTWLPRIAGGGAVVPLAHAEPGRSWMQDRTTTVTDGALHGTKTAVPVADAASAFLVTAVEDGDFGVYLVEAGADGLTLDVHRAADWTRSAVLTFDGTPAVRLGGGSGSGSGDRAGAALRAFRRATALGRIAETAYAVGLAETALSMTAEYLTVRKQFRVTLNKFQVLVHRAAQMYSDVELTRSMALWATAVAETAGGPVVGTASGDGDGDGSGDRDGGDSLDLLTSTADEAFAFVAGQARQIAEEAVQLHGGIGMTYEARISHVAAGLTAVTQAFGGVLETRSRVLASGSPESAPSALLHNELAQEA